MNKCQSDFYLSCAIAELGNKNGLLCCGRHRAFREQRDFAGGNAMRKGEQIKKEQGSGPKQEQKGIHLKTHRGDERYHRKNFKKERTHTRRQQERS